jgi:hypothetical protein
MLIALNEPRGPRLLGNRSNVGAPHLAAITENEINSTWLVWSLFQNGGVVLFKRRDVLDATTDKLRSCGYRGCVVNCQACPDEESLLKAIVDALAMSRYPNVNLDGFNDYVSQIDFDGGTGVIVVLIGYHQFRTRFPECAFHILDIMADNHRANMLKGNRLLTLVQSDDPHIGERIGRVGGYKPHWNSSEWFTADRA